ncbi:MAG: LPXTG cell wall anchor domain-containing protein [Spirochaetes bacterium]|nr:LPXTG cell wall anchor domain-containing protein [Spirochaetota bacterium]
MDYLIVGGFVLAASAYLFFRFRKNQSRSTCAKCGDAAQH